jgi:protein arginine kinase activator
MVCNICGKNVATVHLTEIIDDQMSELHLCEECARKKSTQMEQQFGLADLLAGLAEFEKPTQEKEIISLKCPSCGLTYQDFKKIGRLGCGECYTTFKKFLGPLLKRIHGSCIHNGKYPPSRMLRPRKKKMDADIAGQTDTQGLRQKLAKAIEMEAYEEAARIRDQIKELQKKQKDSGNLKGKQ